MTQIDIRTQKFTAINLKQFDNEYRLKITKRDKESMNIFVLYKCDSICFMII